MTNNLNLLFRDLEEENLDRGSLASFGSGNTTDSDKVSGYNIEIIILVD